MDNVFKIYENFLLSTNDEEIDDDDGASDSDFSFDDDIFNNIDFVKLADRKSVGNTSLFTSIYEKSFYLDVQEKLKHLRVGVPCFNNNDCMSIASMNENEVLDFINQLSTETESKKLNLMETVRNDLKTKLGTQLEKIKQIHSTAEENFQCRLKIAQIVDYKEKLGHQPCNQPILDAVDTVEQKKSKALDLLNKYKVIKEMFESAHLD